MFGQWQQPQYSQPAQAPQLPIGDQSRPAPRQNNTGLILGLLGGAGGASTGIDSLAGVPGLDAAAVADIPLDTSIVGQGGGGLLDNNMPKIADNPMPPQSQFDYQNATPYGLLGNGIGRGVESFNQGYQNGGGILGGFGQIGSDLVNQGNQYWDNIGGLFR